MKPFSFILFATLAILICFSCSISYKSVPIKPGKEQPSFETGDTVFHKLDGRKGIVVKLKITDLALSDDVYDVRFLAKDGNYETIECSPAELQTVPEEPSKKETPDHVQ